MVAKSLRNTTVAFLMFILFSGTAPNSFAGASSRTTKATVLADRAYYAALLSKIREAEKSIDLVMYLWKMGGAGGGKPAEIAKALGDARQRGVAIRVILEYSDQDEKLNRANRKTAELLLREGIVTFFDSPSVTTHTKLAIIDHRFILLGSHNLTQSALENNHELSLLLDDPPMAEEISGYVESLLKNR